MTTYISGFYSPQHQFDAHFRAASLKEYPHYPHHPGGSGNYLSKVKTAEPAACRSRVASAAPLNRKTTTDVLRSVHPVKSIRSSRLLDLFRKGLSRAFGLRSSSKENITEHESTADVLNQPPNASNTDLNFRYADAARVSVQALPSLEANQLHPQHLLMPLINRKKLDMRILREANKVYFKSFENRQVLNPNSIELHRRVVAALQQHELYGQLKYNVLSIATALALRQLSPDYTLSNEGDYFKAHKALPEYNPWRRLNASIIRTPNGQLFELINTPDAHQREMLYNQARLNTGSGKFYLGAGGFGKVRLARNLQTGEFVAVKKFFRRQDADAEIAGHCRIGLGKGLNTMLDYAHVKAIGRFGKQLHKSYIFLPLSNRGNGVDAARRLQRLRQFDPGAADHQLMGYDFNYAETIATLHATGLVHRDIKPENYLHSSDGSVRLADFGFTTDAAAADKTPQVNAGTLAFVPPEIGTSSYNSIMHDAFSLGMTMLNMKLGILPAEYRGPHLVIHGQPLSLFNDARGVSSGINLAHPSLQHLKYETRDEVIAGLLSRSPQTRLTPGNALNTPYMKQYALSHGSDHVYKKSGIHAVNAGGIFSVLPLHTFGLNMPVIMYSMENTGLDRYFSAGSRQGS